MSAGVGEAILSHLDGPLGQELLLRTSGFDKQGHRIIIAMAEDLSPLNADVWEFRKRYALVSVVILAALIALQTGIVRVSLRPLRQAREDLAHLKRGEVQRINSEVPAEIIPLVDELNRMLQVMSARLERSRNALGNLAHALKTPLTLLTRLADDPALERSTALRERLLQHVGSVNRLVERELKRARLAGGAMPGQQVDLQQEIGSLVVALKRMTLEQGEKLMLRVEDDGPGCPGDLLDDLLRRGMRVDESRAGHGLGLAIARDVVASYGGEIQLGRSAALGGFEALIHLALPYLPW
jgi:signal transduction histidine kinase